MISFCVLKQGDWRFFVEETGEKRMGRRDIPFQLLQKEGLDKKSWLVVGEFGIRALRRVKIVESTANSD